MMAGIIVRMDFESYIPIDVMKAEYSCLGQFWRNFRTTKNCYKQKTAGYD